MRVMKCEVFTAHLQMLQNVTYLPFNGGLGDMYAVVVFFLLLSGRIGGGNLGSDMLLFLSRLSRFVLFIVILGGGTFVLRFLLTSACKFSTQS